MDIKETQNEKSRRLSRKWKQEGRCIHCGGGRDNKLYLVCTKCREANHTAQRHMKAQRIAVGVCMRCGKEPIKDGYKTCESCTKKAYSYHKNNPMAIEKSRLRYQRVKNEVFIAYGGYECQCCGEKEPMFLCIDHINGGGEKQRTEIGVGTRGRNMYTWLKKNNFPSGYQVLCHNCNNGKYLNGGACPHKNPNASRNIRDCGIALMDTESSSGINACGVNARPLSGAVDIEAGSKSVCNKR